MTNSGTQQRTKLPEKAPVRNAARSLSNWPTKGSQQCEKTTRKQAVTRNRSTQPMRSRAGAFRLGSRFSICLSGLIGFLRRYEKKRAATIFFAAVRRFLCRDVRFFMPCRPVRGRNTPSRPPLRPCSGIRFLPPGSFVRALACRRLRFSHYVPALAFRPFRPGSYPALASEPLSPGCPCAGTHGSPRPVPPAGQFTTTVGKYSRKSAAARSDCFGVFSCTPASLYSLPIASYLWTPSV